MTINWRKDLLAQSMLPLLLFISVNSLAVLSRKHSSRGRFSVVSEPRGDTTCKGTCNMLHDSITQQFSRKPNSGTNLILALLPLDEKYFETKLSFGPLG